MKIWIRTQDKKRLVEVDNITLKGSSLKYVNQQYPFGILLGKYRDGAKAQSVLDTIFTRIKVAGQDDCVFEMPEDY